MPQDQTHRAGGPIEDFCRACKTDRMHTVIAVDEAGRPVRVSCGFCRSEHNYRGGPRVTTSGAPLTATAAPGPRARPSANPFPIVSERERIARVMSATTPTPGDLELLLRRIIREEAGITPAVPAEKWHAGAAPRRRWAATEELADRDLLPQDCDGA